MVRLAGSDVVTDHDLLTDVGEDDHHDAAETVKVQVNAQAIPASSTYELRYSLGSSSHRVAWGVLRGVINTDILGHEGVFFLAHDTADEAATVGIRRYGAGGYPTSYVGAYARLHGDSYLSHTETFGPNIRFDDAWIDGDELVLEFRNTHPTLSRNLTVYGAVAVK